MQLENTVDLNLGALLVSPSRLRTIVVDLHKVFNYRLYGPHEEFFDGLDKLSGELFLKASQISEHLGVLHPDQLELAVLQMEHRVTLTEMVIQLFRYFCYLCFFLAFASLGYVRDLLQLLGLLPHVEAEAKSAFKYLVRLKDGRIKVDLIVFVFDGTKGSLTGR